MNTLSQTIGAQVKAYRNLNNGKWSIKTTKVVGYPDFVVLNAVTFTGANTKAQARIQAGEHRSVHAYAQGTLYGLDPYQTVIPWGDNVREVTYHPKKRAGFYDVRSGDTVTSADVAIFTNGKMFCLNPR
jgi:hypothetical protein